MKKPTASSAFSKFIRNATPEEKAEVYALVLMRATKQQNRKLKAAFRSRPRSRNANT